MPILTTLGAACAKAWGFTSGLVKDQYFNLTTLLLPGNGTNGKQNNTFLDGSSNNFTITPNGNTTQGTFSPFSQTGWGNYFNGSSNYRLTIPDSTDLDIAGNFCLELWAYFTSTSGANQLVCIGSEISSQNGFVFYQTNTTEVVLYTNGTAAITTSGAGITANRWYHLALVRSGTGAGNMVIYVDGVSRGSAQITTSFTGLAGNGLAIGQTYSGSHVGVCNAYLSNVRLVNGSPVYTGAFTPPTTPLTAITNTKLLTCQSNRFVDANTQVAAKTITVTGTPSVQAFSPFAPTAAYTTAAVGGSGYFDGNLDYLSVANTGLFGSGDWTVEMWVNAPVGQTDKPILECRNPATGTGSTTGFTLTLITSTEIRLYSGAELLKGTVNYINTWAHVAVSKKSGTTRLYLNGTSVASTASLGTMSDTTFLVAAGYYGSTSINAYGQFYMSGLRVLTGTGYDTSTITIPTSPPTAITNTSLLLNYTNAGITDATAKNDLETVGNAQISTSVSKFGGGSIALDGTGDGLFSDASPTINAMTLGTGDFCIEFWVYFNSLSGTPNLLDMRPVATQGVYPSMYVDTSKVSIYVNSATLITGTTTMSTGQWYHIAWSRISGQSALYVGGTRQGASSTADTNNYLCSRVVFGIDRGLSTNPVNGYFDDIRITKGNGRGYTGASITVPSAPFPVQ